MTKLVRLPETDSHYALKYDPKKHIIRVNLASACEIHRGVNDDDEDDIAVIRVYKRTPETDETSKQETIWECFECDQVKLFAKLLPKVIKLIMKDRHVR